MSTTTAEAEAPETPQSDGPLLDLTDAAVKKFIKQAKARGYVTMDELNKVLPSEEVTSEQIEDTLAMLSEMGVNVVDSEEDAEGGEVVVRAEAEAEGEAKAEGEGEDGESDEDFDDGAGPTISAMEAELREGVMATLDAIAGEFEAFRLLQEKLVAQRLKGEDLTDKDRAAYG